MKSKILFFVVALLALALFSTEKLSAQNSVSLHAHNTGYIDVTSYNGHVSSGIFVVRIDIKGTENDPLDWSLLVRTKDIITNKNNIIDPSNVSIRLNRVETGPNLNQTTPVPLSLEEKEVIKASGSNAPIMPPPGRNNIQWVFHFDILVAPGGYLESLKSWGNYDLDLDFILQNVNGIISEAGAGVKLRINPNLTGTPPTKPTFGLEVNANASLNFNAPEDYMKKVENAEESWVKVNSKEKGYVIRVQSLYSNFNQDSSAPPVDVVSIKLEGTQGNGTSSEIVLKDTEQIVFNGNATGAESHRLNIRYFITEDNAMKLIKYEPGAYATTLIYTLIPQ